MLVKVLASQVWDPENDNVDVEVTLDDGTRYAATFFTIANVRKLFERNRSTGECHNGLYLWAANMILVERLTIEVVEATVHSLLKDDEFESAFALIT